MFDAALSVAASVGAAGLLLVGWMFVRSLLPGATPLVYRFAQAEDPDTAQQPAAQRYLRWLTALWAIALLSAAYIVGRRIVGTPVLLGYAGLAAPIAPAALLFFGERLVRRHVFGEGSVGPVARQWRIASDILRREALASLPRRAEPVLRPADSARALVVWRDRTCTVGQLQAAAVSLTTGLPRGQKILVACEDRAVFLWAVLAVWAARGTVVLAPPDLKAPIDGAAAGGPEFVITDRADAVPAGSVPVRVVDGAALRDALRTAADVVAPICLAPSHPAAVFFTSGSTGQPAAHAKTWRQLTLGAEAMRQLLAIDGRAPLLGGTVAHAHKFGFEMLVMQALRGEATLWGHRIVFPADLDAFCDARAGEKWLVTTPFHLEVFTESGRPHAGLARIVSATMPLSPELATRTEQASGAQVHEIYGSTEAGCVGTRRTTRQSAWTLAPDLRLASGPDGSATLLGERVGGALPLRDRVAEVQGGFELIGRDTDLVKIAGKRTSLQALTAVLRRIDGVDDGVVIDGAAVRQRRLAAVVVAPRLSSEAIRAALAARVDAAFMPRPIVLLDALPRDANGKLRLDELSAHVAAAGRRPVRQTADNPEHVR